MDADDIDRIENAVKREYGDGMRQFRRDGFVLFFSDGVQTILAVTNGVKKPGHVPKFATYTLDKNMN